jgi:hypothetical protein
VIAIAALALTGAPCLDGASRQQKPVHESIVEREFKEPPPTVSGAFRAAEAVVSIEVESAETSDRKVTGQTGAAVVTEFRCRLLDVFKRPQPFQRSDVAVLMDSGERDRGSYIERVVVRGAPALDVRGRYILFLSWSARLGGWVSAFGPYSIWSTDGNVLRCMRMSRLCSGLAGLDASQFAAKLRGAR